MAPNVHRAERVVAAAAAAGLLAWVAAEDDREDPLKRAAPWAAGVLLFRALTGYCPIYGALGTGTRRTDTRTALAGPRGIHVRESTTVARRPHEIYALWRTLENLPRFMSHLESVREIDERRSHWVTKPVAGMRFEWDAEIVNEEEGEHIGWRSLPKSDVVSAGSVHFKPAPGGRGTEIHVVLQYDPPAGRLGRAIARLLGNDPASQVREDLRRFKQWLEAGAPPTTEGQPSGARTAAGRLMQRVEGPGAQGSAEPVAREEQMA
jgi:uncharacterized membrane protein